MHEQPRKLYYNLKWMKRSGIKTRHKDILLVSETFVSVENIFVCYCRFVLQINNLVSYSVRKKIKNENSFSVTIIKIKKELLSSMNWKSCCCNSIQWNYSQFDKKIGTWCYKMKRKKVNFWFWNTPKVASKYLYRAIICYRRLYIFK